MGMMIKRSPAAKWQRSSSVKASETIQLGRRAHQYQSMEGRSLWQGLWRKISRRKRMILGAVTCGTSATLMQQQQQQQQAYDADDYSKNFDQGMGWDDSDDYLPRSFSARFADPSRILHRTASTCYAR